MAATRHSQHGTTLIEVLVTILIIAFGLLGLAGLMSRVQSMDLESYQRGQALLLLSDMAQRISTNRLLAASYVTTAATPQGAGVTCSTDTSTLQKSDTGDWCRALQGAAESIGGSSVGALIGGRGCVESLGSGEYLVTVAWQGMTPIVAPPSSIACGKDQYDGAQCTLDRCRRVVTTIVRIGSLS